MQFGSVTGGNGALRFTSNVIRSIRCSEISYSAGHPHMEGLARNASAERSAERRASTVGAPGTADKLLKPNIGYRKAKEIKEKVVMGYMSSPLKSPRLLLDLEDRSLRYLFQGGVL